MDIQTVTARDEDGNKAIADATAEADEILQNYTHEEIVQIIPQVTETLASDGLVYTRYTIMIVINPAYVGTSEDE